MILCAVIYVALLVLMLFRKRKKIPVWMRDKNIYRIMFLMNSIAIILFISDFLSEDTSMNRDSYGGDRKTQEYYVSVDGQLEEELVVVEVDALEYSEEEVENIFEQVMAELDVIVLGDNETCDHVESRLNFVDSIEGYPVDITWQIEPFGILEVDGTIVQEKVAKDGSMVKATAVLSSGERDAMYIMNFMVYPKTKSEKEMWLEKIENSVVSSEKATRTQEQFVLPDTVDGKEIEWVRKSDTRGYDILFLGVVLCALIIWRRKQNEKEAVEKMKAQMMRDYPDILSKFTLLLETGLTLKTAWKKIVDNYEIEKESCGKHAVYEEMCITCKEMNSGIPEAESYERFGKRCGLVNYMKFGALLSQNLRKGNKGLAGILAMESMQAFEIRKSEAKRLGEEASAKLLIPMFAMLAVVMLIVIVPAFMSIQI